jgi:integrase
VVVRRQAAPDHAPAWLAVSRPKPHRSGLFAATASRGQVAAEVAGIHSRVSPHTLRHSFATYPLEQDVDIRVTQVLLGHSKLETIALYAKVSTRTIHAVTGPLDRLTALMGGQDAARLNRACLDRALPCRGARRPR